MDKNEVGRKYQGFYPSKKNMEVLFKKKIPKN